MIGVMPDVPGPGRVVLNRANSCTAAARILNELGVERTGTPYPEAATPDALLNWAMNLVALELGEGGLDHPSDDVWLREHDDV